MANIFTPRADVLLRAGLWICAAGVAGAGLALYVLGRPDVSAWQRRVVPQPVMFSHEHHVGGLGLDCRYCHQGTEKSDYAGMPSAETCMNCHLQLYTGAAMLQPVRDAWSLDRPVRWNRVYRLPDFVRFSHRVHVNGGIACRSCHGRMDEQPLTAQATPLTMGWCLECHRRPADHLVESAQVFLPTAVPGSAPAAESRVDRPEVLTNCSACHS